MKRIAAMVAFVLAVLVLSACGGDGPFSDARACKGGEASPISVREAARMLRPYGLGEARLSCSTGEPKVLMLYVRDPGYTSCHIYAEPRQDKTFSVTYTDYYTRVVRSNLECFFDGRPSSNADTGLVRRMKSYRRPS